MCFFWSFLASYRDFLHFLAYKYDLEFDKIIADFDEYIKPLEQRWSKFINKGDQELIVHSNDYGYFNLDVKCNWKIIFNVINTDYLTLCKYKVYITKYKKIQGEGPGVARECFYGD